MDILDLGIFFYQEIFSSSALKIHSTRIYPESLIDFSWIICISRRSKCGYSYITQRFQAFGVQELSKINENSLKYSVRNI